MSTLAKNEIFYQKSRFTRFTRFTKFTRFTSMSKLAKNETFYQQSRFTRFTRFTKMQKISIWPHNKPHMETFGVSSIWWFQHRGFINMVICKLVPAQSGQCGHICLLRPLHCPCLAWPAAAAGGHCLMRGHLCRSSSSVIWILFGLKAYLPTATGTCRKSSVSIGTISRKI